MSIKQKQCKKCKNAFKVTNEEWREYSTYSVKLAQCPMCGCVNEVQIIEDKGLFINFDDRYYY